MRLFFLVTALLCECSFAQSPTDVFDQAPPQVEKALRERVAVFFQAHVTGKFRDAETVVHEDSREAFYNAEKRRYLGFSIAKITYSENFTKADVITSVELDWNTPRLGKLRVKPPLRSLWKYDAGQWWYYVVPQTDWETPWGRMKPGEEAAAGVAPKWTVPDAEAVLSQVKVNRTAIHLKSYEKSEDYAEITNSMPGELTLKVENPSPLVGVTVSLDRELLKAGETARVVFRHEPTDQSAKPTRTVHVIASPTGKVFTFTLTFAVPPEIEKLLPKQ